MYDLKKFVREQMVKDGYIVPPHGFELRIQGLFHMQQIVLGKAIMLYKQIGNDDYCFVITPNEISCYNKSKLVNACTNDYLFVLTNHLKDLLSNYEEDTHGQE